MNIFTLLTPITYWLLVALWLFVLIFYIRRLISKEIISPLTRLLIVILAIDAFRTLFESCYFGAWYTSLAGLIPREVHNVLVRPELVIIPKLTNLLAVVVVVFILLRRWLPQEEHEKEQLNALIQEQISELTEINNKLRIENSERKKAEEALNRLNRELRAISDCNQVLVRAEDEQTLLDEICRIVCDEAGYRMAFVGYAENDTAKSVRSVAWGGVEDDYLAQAGLTWADTERGRGPAGTAIRSGRTDCSQDIAADPRMAPWRENALQRGYRSIISMPLKDENANVFGVFLIYSSEPNTFTPDEIRLLEELAGDLAFGIQALRNRNARQEAEQQIFLLSFALDNVREAAYLIDEQARFLYVNDESCRVLGYGRDELLALGVADVDPDFPLERWIEHWAELKNRRSLSFEERHKTKDGRIFPVEISANYLEYDGQGYNLALVRDITERKQAEEERSLNLRYFESMDKVNRAIQGASGLEGMLSDLLDAVLNIFDCDRAFLMYPCDPEAASWSVPVERTKPEYPGVLELGINVPMSAQVAQTLRILLEADGPIQFGPGTEHPLPADASERFGFKCFMSMAVRPKTGSPWQFGLHQCSRVRNWAAEEERLFQAIARRLADGLSTMLVYRDLLESEQRYRLVFENSPVSIWEEDFSGVKTLLDGLKQEGVTDIGAHLKQHPETIRHCAQMAKIVDVNEAALVLHGAASKEALLAGLIETFTAESFDTFREELICLWNGANAMMRDAVVKTLAGDRRDVTIYFAVCPGYEKTLGKVIVSLVDITERKQANESLRQSEARLSEAQRIAHLGNWELDLAGNTLLWSDEIYHIFEIDRKQFGASYDAFLGAIHPDDRELVNRAYTQSVADRTPYGIVHRLLMEDGRIKYVEERCETSYDEDGRPLRSIGTVQDITGIKLAEEALHLRTVELEAEVAERQVAQENLQEQALLLENEMEERRNTQDELEKLNESLEQHVQERTADLEQANTRLQELDRMKSMFIASMSHELRTPLNSVIGFSRILLSEWLGPLNGEQKENLTAVLRSGNHLLSLINDVIDVSKIEAGLIEAVPEEVDVHDVVSEAVTSCENAAQDKGINLKIQTIHHTLHTDRTRLLQCLLNLISNAVKYTEKGTITVCAEVPDGDDTLELSVADTGVGIQEKDLGKLFSPFVRLNSPLTSTVPGTGLGLYLTRKLAREVLQGDLTVTSTSGVGSRFVLRVPITL
jgi:PAS domain S-box-containing protein